MATEIEIKYLFPADQMAALADCLSALGTNLGHQLLDNEYFDSDQQSLIQHRCALRIRRQYAATVALSEINQANSTQQTPIAVEQTLKTAGQEVQGIFQRHEWNWPLANDARQLDLNRLQQTEIQPYWPAQVSFDQLKGVFRTIFERQRWLIEWQGYQFEAAIDHGIVTAANKTDQINELELEWLNQGDLADVETPLRDLGRLLAETIDLVPSSLSKAHRGYQLLQSNSA